MKLLRTIRLDPSDTFVFEKGAEPGEWAVPGGFAFADIDPATLTGKARAAFRAGFLGIESLGWSTLVQIVDASEDDRDRAVERLAQRLNDNFVAAEEVAFAESLCDHPINTLIALHRVYEDGAVRETFRTLTPRAGAKPLRAFAFLEVEDEEAAQEAVDLAALAREPKA